MKCWLIRYTLRGNNGNGWALVIAKTASTAIGIILRQGHLAGVGYEVYSAEEFTQIEIDRRCCRDTIIAEGLTTKGEDGVSITDITYNKDTGILTITLSNGDVKEFSIGKQPDWAETDPEDSSYIKNKPDLAEVATSGSYNDLLDKPTIPTIPDIEKGETIGDGNAVTDMLVSGHTITLLKNTTFLTLHLDISGKADKSVAIGNLTLTINPNTYVITLNGSRADGSAITSQTIDLPLESVVVSGSYDSENKKVVLTLKDGSTIEFSVADLINGLQSEITSSNKLDADLVDDSTSIHKFTSAEEKTKLAGIETGAKKNVKSDWNETNSNSDAFILNKPLISSSIILSDDLDVWVNVSNDAIPTWTSLGNLAYAVKLYVLNNGKQADWDESDSDDAAYILNKPFQGIDAAPTENSNNVVSSHGIYIAIASTLGLLNSILEYINYGTYNDNFSFDFPATFDSLS